MTEIVDKDTWQRERVALLAKEKEFSKLRDALSAKVRALPAHEVDDYVFHDADGEVPLSALFKESSQLIVYHYMFDPEWQAGCRSCALVTDTVAHQAPHLRARDTELVLVSRADVDKLHAFRERMGWDVRLGVVRTDALQRGLSSHARGTYNYKASGAKGEMPGLSVFAKREGKIVHTYSSYSRGLECFMGAYRLLDVVPKGRDEEETGGMGWTKLRDLY